MKILLTGAPGSGKTTAIIKFLDQVRNKQGFVTREILENGARTGFQAIASNGQSAVIASIYSNSELRVNKFGVEVEEFEKFLNSLPRIETDTLLYIDEIGQMELYSERFKKLASQYLSLPNPFAGTVSQVYDDEFIKQVLARDDVFLITITPQTRQQVDEILLSIAAGVFSLADLKPQTQKEVIKMAKAYLQNGQLVQLNKLFKNAVMYTAEARVEQIDQATIMVKGNSINHRLNLINGKWACDCDLFNGRKIFEGKAGECSHIQAINLTKINSGPA